MRISLTLCSLLLLLSTTAWAGGSARAHDGGFLLRMTLGGGTANTSISNGIDEVEFSGGMGEFTIAVGGVIRENFALHGTVFAYSIADPEVKANGSRLGTANANLTMSGVGGGFTWWAMPADLYFSGTLGVGTLTVDPDGGGSESSDAGFAMEVTVGKEWFVSDRWGLGLAGGMTYHNVPDGLIPENWSGTSFALRFSATFN